MKIAVRGGHNFQATGASGIIDETTEDRKVKDAVIKYLSQEGHETLDVTPGNCDVNSDLSYGVNMSNEWCAEYFISIHFNKAYNSYIGSIGTEAWVYSTGGQAEKLAKRIVDKLATTGLKNRGVKVNSKLYELKATNMPAVIVETCFTEATEDVRIYREKGFDAIGKLIAEGILNKLIQEATITPNQPQNSVNTEIFYRVITGSYKDRTNAEAQVDKLKQCGFDSFIDILKK